MTIDPLVAAGVCLARGPEGDVSEALTWVEVVAEICAVGVPAGVVIDIGRLLMRQPADVAESPQTGHAGLDQALGRYDEHVLGRLTADRLLTAAADALAALPTTARAEAIALVVDEIMQRLGLDAEPVAAGRVRRAVRLPIGELRTAGWEALGGAQGPADVLMATYLTLVDGARRLGRLLGPTEVYTIANFEALRGAAQRLALRQITEAASRFTLPRRVRRTRTKIGRAAAMADDDSAYPAGGFAALTTTGGLSNLVSSELIYMDDTVDIDAFAIRWASGELLKYTRDESVFRRERRTITFALADLDAARIKDPDAPAQRIVLGLGALVAGIEALVVWLDRMELLIRVVFGDGLDDEQALLGLRLRALIEAGLVELTHDLPADAEPVIIDAATLADDFDTKFRQTLFELV